ncbi:MAG: hypothetical protein NTW59_02835, partial [Candidatus Diapherotrites archaeon]|nr:hypothetical protein [Candidatus Diapherotrites archaeon]
GQFREKLFDYQSKLAELKLKKRLLEEAKGKKPGETDVKVEKVQITAQQKLAQAGKEAAGAGDYGISTRVARALEKIAERAAAMPSYTPPVKGAMEEEKVAEALVKIADRAVGAQGYAAPPKPAGEEEKMAWAIERMAEKVARIPEYKAGAGQAAPAAEAPIKERVIERIIERQPRSERFEAPPIEEREGDQGFWDEWAKPEQRAQKAGKGKPQPGTQPPRAQAGRAQQQAGWPAQRPARPAYAPPSDGWGAEELEKQRVEKPRLSDRLEKALQDKAGGRVDKGQLDRLEDELAQLLKKYKVPERTLESQIQSLDSNRLVDDFHKLINLIELQEETRREEMIKPAPGFEEMTITSQKKEKIETTEKEIVKAKIETDFDRILNVVKFKGAADLDEIAKELGMEKARVQEYSRILEENKLVEVIYPPIGSVKLAFPGYLRWKDQQKKKQEEEKKKKTEKK